MRDGWKTVKIADVCEVFTDGNWIETKDQSPEGIRLIQTGNIGTGIFKNRREKARYISEETFAALKCFEIHEGDILVSRLPDPVGRSCILEPTGDRMITAVDCSIIRLKTSLAIPEFFNYYCQSKDYFHEVSAKCTGATRKRISRKNLGTIEVSLPPLPEQERIVSILDKAFEGIDKAIAQTEQNLASARELFESYLNNIFTQKGEDWVEKKLEEVCSKIGSGATPKGGAESYKTEGISLIRSLNVYDWRFTIKKLAYIDDDQAAKLKNVIVEEADVLFNITGASVARCCVVPDELLPARVNQHVSILRPKQDELSSGFLCYLLTSRPYKEILLGIGDEGGSTRQAITKKQLQDLVVSFPDLLAQQTTVASLLEAHSKSKSLQALYTQKLNDLKELKQSLLQQAFAGELTKEDAA